MFSTQSVALFFSVLLSGLIAGLLYSYSVSVNAGLGNLTDREYLNAFQSINRSILNPAFFLSFMGTLIVLPIAAWICHNHVTSTSFYLLIAAAVLYLVGVFGVTMMGNVPLNEALDAFNISGAGDSVIAEKRLSFEKPWNFYHSIRTIASILVASLTILSILVDKKS